MCRFPTLAGFFLLTTCLAVTAGLMVQVKVVVDELGVQNWKKVSGKSSKADLIEEINSLFVEVGELYTGLPKSFPITFAIKNLTLGAKDIVSAPFGEIGTAGLQQYYNWMEDQGITKKDYDLAILLTGNDVVGGTTSLLGYGQIGRVCLDMAVGMLEFRKITYKTAFVMAHEIGHILGAQHDGNSDSISSKCKADEGYIMSPNTEVSNPNHFKFSDCSYLHLYYHAQLPCLTDGKPEEVTKGKRFGTIVSADETCRREFGKQAYLQRRRYVKYGDDVCTHLLCNSGEDLVDVFAPQGMYCGKSKQCIKGKCIKTDEGDATVSDVCPFGDQPAIDYKGYRTCDELPLYECPVMKYQCCKRCNLDEISAPDEACRRLTKQPDAMLLRYMYQPYGYGDYFCKNLYCTTGMTHSTYEKQWFATPDNMICGQNKRCQNGKCVKSKTGNPDITDVCPFGDLPWVFGGYRMPCEKISQRYNCKRPLWANTCCYSCRQ